MNNTIITNSNQFRSDCISFWSDTTHGPQPAEMITMNGFSDMHLTAMYGGPFAASCSNPQPAVDYQLSSALLLPISNPSTTTTMCTPSTYSDENWWHWPVMVPGMSATALLQKAVQMGVTTSSSADPPFLGGGLDMKCMNSFGQNRLNVGFGLPEVVSDRANCFISPMSSSLLWRENDMGDGETRDFFGVGVEPRCPPCIEFNDGFF